MPINRTKPEDMDQWYDPTAYLAPPTQKEVIKCKCGCEYFEQVEASKFPKVHSVIIGQAVPVHREITFYVLRCMRPTCGEIYEPTVQNAGGNRIREVYDHFLDQMEGKDLEPASEDESAGEVL